MNSKKDQFIAYLDAAGFALPEIENYLSKHKKKAAGPPSVYEARRRGKEYCQTEGSEHYRQGHVEPLDLLISAGAAEDFCVGNIVKYATRFRKTRNVDDIKKAVDYAHILCGMALGGQPWTRNNGTGKY